MRLKCALIRLALVVLLGLWTWSLLPPATGYKLGKRRVQKRMLANDFGEFMGEAKNCRTAGESCPDNEGAGANEKNEKSNCNIKLTSSKKKASNIAQKAAMEAKAASDAQVSAGEAASRQVKSQLADKALAAAKAAEAALAGKQQIVEQLEQEVREGEMVVQEQTASLQTTQCNCQAAAKAAKQAGLQLKMLTEAVKNAQDNVQNSNQAASGAQQEQVEKQQLVEAAKHRVEQLLRQLEAARIDYKATKLAAERAACAAEEARKRASVERERKRRMAQVLAKLIRRRRHHRHYHQY